MSQRKHKKQKITKISSGPCSGECSKLRYKKAEVTLRSPQQIRARRVQCPSNRHLNSVT